MRLAARSNWLSTMAFPDIVVRAEPAGRSGSAVAVKDAPGSSPEAAADQAGRPVLRFGERVRDVGAAPAPLAAVREDADHIRALLEGAGMRLDGVLQHEYESRALLDDGADERCPGVVVGKRPPGDEERARLRVEARAADERHAQPVPNGPPGGRRRPDGHDLSEAPAGVAGELEQGGRKGAVSGRLGTLVGREHDGAGLCEPALGRRQLVRAARRVTGVPPGDQNLALRRLALLVVV